MFEAMILSLATAVGAADAPAQVSATAETEASAQFAAELQAGIVGPAAPGAYEYQSTQPQYGDRDWTVTITFAR